MTYSLAELNACYRASVVRYIRENVPTEKLLALDPELANDNNVFDRFHDLIASHACSEEELKHALNAYINKGNTPCPSRPAT